jgi:phospholipid transport system substrate-binding protein
MIPNIPEAYWASIRSMEQSDESTMIDRRYTLISGLALAVSGPGAGLAWAGAGLYAGPPVPRDVSQANFLVSQTCDHLVAVMNGPGDTAAKWPSLTQILENAVDIDGVGRSCLGQFWAQASPDQQRRYLAVFHQVLIASISAKMEQYKDARPTVEGGEQRNGDVVVNTIVEWPNKSPTADLWPTSVDWVVKQINGAPRIIDLVAKGGESLRLVKQPRVSIQQEYGGFLSKSNNSIDALIGMLTRKLARNL